MIHDLSIRLDFSEQSFVDEFERFKRVKTDRLDKSRVKVRHGCDGITLQQFEQDLQVVARGVCRQIRNGTYIFSPLVEVPINKRPDLYSLDEAIERSEIRLISQATIRDRIVQGLIYQAILPFCERKFQTTQKVSFAYRPNASAPEAARRVYDILHFEKYSFVLDVDIIKYFDQISHKFLGDSISEFFEDCDNHELLCKLLKRFYSTDRVEFKSYDNDFKYFLNNKPIRTRRIQGIPQGGVLSGLLANIYLFSFDQWIVQKFCQGSGAKYVRYADDFLLFFHIEDNARAAFVQVSEYLSKKGLSLHPLGQKSNIHNLGMTCASVDYVGYSISPDAIKIQPKNIDKFLNRIQERINHLNISTYPVNEAARLLYKTILPKVLGTVMFWPQKCNQCQLPIRQHSWLHFFSSLTDVNQLKDIDRQIRLMISKKIYADLKARVNLSILRGPDYPTLARKYYQLRKEVGRPISYCSCDRYAKSGTKDNFDQIFGF